MTLTYSISFEYLRDAPRTVKGSIIASSVRSCISRAVRDALRDPDVKGTKWSSMVVVVEKG